MRFERLLILGVAAAVTVGCGQKGPLYLPDRSGEVVTRPGALPGTSSPDVSSAPAPSPADQPAPAPAPGLPDPKDPKPK